MREDHGTGVDTDPLLEEGMEIKYLKTTWEKVP